MNKHTALKKYFGYDSFRDGQEEIIDNILSGEDVLAIMPTGAGKSLCFQLPALIFNSTTIVISPLISLMKDQILSLRQNGISAETINSSLDKNALKRAYDFVRSGKCRLLYISPERLSTPEFLSLVDEIKIDFVCIDEAHCVSHWGQDFRSSYLEIKDFISSLAERPVVASFTATATDIVRADIIKYIGLNNPKITVTGFDRKNLYFEVKKPDDKFTELRKQLDSHLGKSAIVYCSTRKTVNEVSEKLNSLGYSSSRYHAGLTPDERRNNQELFIDNKVSVMVATNAFGMGIDKSDVSLVVHYNMPSDIESYYQEAGRAGRDGNNADCVLLYSYQDVKIQEFLINNSSDNENLTEKETEQYKKRRMSMLRCMQAYCTSSECLRNTILLYFGEQKHDDCKNCSACLGEKRYADITLDSQKVLSAVVRTNGKCTVNELVALLHGDGDYFSFIKTFGVMKPYESEYIRKVIECLIDNGFITPEKSEKGNVLVFSPKSNKILFEKQKISMEYAAIITPVYTINHKTSHNNKPDLVLYSILKVLRAEMAEKLSVPPLAIFTDAVLRQMSIIKPLDNTQLKKIDGMSESKINRFAPAFLKEIIHYVKS